MDENAGNAATMLYPFSAPILRMPGIVEILELGSDSRSTASVATLDNLERYK